MSTVQEALQLSLKKCLPEKGELRILVACSGGVDSMVLLDALLRFPVENVILLGALHLDHSLRVESGADANFVQTFCESMQVPCFVRKVRPPEGRFGLEEWGRNERYIFFSEVREKEGADLVLTAHHRDDLNETFLFRLCTGRLPIQADGVIRRVDNRRGLLRPLLSVSRDEISAYAKENSVPFAEDHSNNDIGFKRNFIRHGILPHIKEGFPSYENAFARFFEKNEAEQRYLEKQAMACVERLKTCSSEQFHLRVPQALATRVLRMLAVKELGPSALELSENRLLILAEELYCAGFREVKKIDLGRNTRAIIDPCLFKNSGLHFEPISNCEQLTSQLSSFPKHAIGEGFVSFPLSGGPGSWRIEAEKVEGEPQRADFVSTLSVLLRGIGLEDISVRKATSDEVLDIPKRGRRTLGKLAKEKRLTYRQRSNLLVFESPREGVFWVPGLFTRDIGGSQSWSLPASSSPNESEKLQLLKLTAYFYEF